MFHFNHKASQLSALSQDQFSYFNIAKNQTGDPQKREDIEDRWKWDLTTIFANDAAWEEAFQELRRTLPRSSDYAGKLAESERTLLAAIRRHEEISQMAGKLYVYAHLKNDENTADNTNAAKLTRAESLLAELSGAWAWMKTELTGLSESIVESFMEDEPDLQMYRRYFADVLRSKPYTLSDKEETLLAKAGQIFDNNSTLFSVLNNADFVFPKVKNGKGETVQITHGRFGELMEDRDREVRRNSFESYYSVYEQFKNTLAAALRGEIQTHNYLAAIRGFSSARERALFNNEIPESVYDHLVLSVNEHLHLLHRYVALRKDRLGLTDFHSYDLYVPMAQDTHLKFTYEDARCLVLDALRPMGTEYMNVVNRAFAERWIDVYETVGKASGGYSSGTYGTNPFILLNWRETLDMVYTLIHEIGHSVHSWYSRSSQPYVYSDYPIFLAEIASTTNENLLTRFLLDNETDQAVRDYVSAHYLDGFKGTVFRQTQFAEFEHLIHRADQEGVALTADFLSEEYDKLNRRYYGSDLLENKQIRLEWSRVPHFYYNYYVYQYATGFSAATMFSEMILDEGESAVKRYIGFLKAGSGAPPIDVLRRAGLDMTSREPIDHAMNTFAKYLEVLSS
ncbi:MAG: oligoendopeptidase F [Fastidiosipilaceae bacterium]|jgi:oligoendopeptidase F